MRTDGSTLTGRFEPRLTKEGRPTFTNNAPVAETRLSIGPATTFGAASGAVWMSVLSAARSECRWAGSWTTISLGGLADVPGNTRDDSESHRVTYRPRYTPTIFFLPGLADLIA